MTLFKMQFSVNSIEKAKLYHICLYNFLLNLYFIPNFIWCGAIPKTQLEVGKTYIGSCRNASEATWKGDHFTYKRYKFGNTFEEDINHFEDDDGYDLFVPIKLKDDE